MNRLSEEKFFQAIEICKSLEALKCKRTNLTFAAIELFCEIAEEPADLLFLDRKYAFEAQEASRAVWQYATHADNWRVDCELGFGVKDHCSILSFFLNLHTHKFQYFTGNLKAPEIGGLLKDWKGIDLTHLIEETPKVAAVES